MNDMNGMNDLREIDDEIYEILKSADSPVYQRERLFGVMDVERKDGRILKDCKVYRTELFSDIDDSEGCYEVEYWARDYGVPNVEYEEIYLGNMSGQNLIVKERTL